MTLDSATFSFAIAMLDPNTLLPTFVRNLTTAPIAFGVLAASYALGHFLPQLIGTHLAMGRVRRKPLYLAIALFERLGILLIAISAQLVGLASRETVLIVFLMAVAFYAMTTGLMGPVSGDLVAKTIVRARGTFYGGSQLLGGAMGFGAAQLAQRLLAANPFPAGQQLCFWLALAFSSLSFVFIAQFREVPFPEQAPRESLLVLLRSVPRVLREHAAYRWYIVGRGVLGLGTMGVGFVAADALRQGFTAADVALFASVYLGAQSVGGLALGVIGDRSGFKLVAELGAIGAIGAMFLALVATNMVVFAAAFVLLGVVNASWLTSDTNISIETAPSTETSRFLGITNSLIAPAVTVAPLIGGVLAALVSYSFTFIVALLCSSLGLVVLAARFEEPRRSTKALASLE